MANSRNVNPLSPNKSPPRDCLSEIISYAPPCDRPREEQRKSEPAAEPLECRHRKAHDVEVAPLDPIDEQGRAPLDRIGARLVAVLARPEIPLDLSRAEATEVDPRAGGGGRLPPRTEVQQTDPGEHLVPAPAQAAEHRARFGLPGGLSEQSAAEGHDRVGADDERGSVPARDRACLQPRQPDGVALDRFARVARGLDLAARLHAEAQAQVPQDLAAARRG